MSGSALILALALLCAVILVNGWTDAPNAIAGVVATGTLSFPAAAALAAGCNLLGALCVTAVNSAVARTLWSIADFTRQEALGALTAALCATVVWAVAAWRFGLPTSESHALVAGLTGAALACGAERLRLLPLAWVAVGLFLSLTLGHFFGKVAARLLPKTGSQVFWRRGQVAGAGLTAFFHGAQDGQKFLGVLVLLTGLATGNDRFSVPIWAACFCAALMGLGTLLGGRRIVDTVGRKLVAVTPRSGCAADLGCTAALAVCTLMGLPVSTTHVKTAAMLGAGEGRANGAVAASLVLAWLLTFPGCGLIAFFLTRALSFV